MFSQVVRSLSAFENVTIFPYFTRVKRVAVGILLRKGLVLACQRHADAKYPLKWEFPGGKVDPGEAHEEALVRELFEELSIHATVDTEFFRQRWEYPDSGSDRNANGVFDVTYFLVRRFEGEPVNNAFEQILWVSPNELQSMNILEGNRQAVDLLVKYVHGQLGPSPSGHGPSTPTESSQIPNGPGQAA